ncbi:MAG: sortase [Lachnospiraceae bacterium]|nr:sortase [Lachnospiraceae bacterium]
MKNKRRNRFIKYMFLAVFVVCLIPVGQEYYLSWRHKSQMNNLRKMAGALTGQEDYGTENTPAPGTEEARRPEASSAPGTEGEHCPESSFAAGIAGESESYQTKEPVILSRYAALYEKNSDFAGWLFIEGTDISYPVMQCEDDEYYLDHDFYGNKDKYGCLYVRNKADLNAGTNFVIYGHNMRDGAMFGKLDLYQKESFYPEHREIFFHTLYEERVYEIIAVFRSQVYNSDDDAFKYYQFYEADTPEEFDYFYENIKTLSLYDTGVTAEFGDTFLTLSTCAYHVEDGRFVVVAKRR